MNKNKSVNVNVNKPVDVLSKGKRVNVSSGSKGTVFLNEFGNLSPDSYQTLMELLEERE